MADLKCVNCGYTPKPGEHASQTWDRDKGKLTYTCPSCKAAQTNKAFTFIIE